MSKQKQAADQVSLWAGSLDDHPTWKFYVEEIERIYEDLNTDRDRAYVDYELIKRAARVSYLNFLENEATDFLKSYAKMTYDQAHRMVEDLSRSIGRVEMKRTSHE